MTEMAINETRILEFHGLRRPVEDDCVAAQAISPRRGARAMPDLADGGIAAPRTAGYGGPLGFKPFAADAQGLAGPAAANEARTDIILTPRAA